MPSRSKNCAVPAVVMRSPRCCLAPKSAMPPDPAPGAAAPTGLDAHLRALESLYGAAPINQYFRSTLTLPEAGRSEIAFNVGPDDYHAAGAAHGTVYFKM